MLPEKLATPLRDHLVRVRALHEADLAAGFGEVYLPWAIVRKYLNAAREWAWQYVFVAVRRSIDPRSGAVRRHHVEAQSIQRAMREALRLAGITLADGPLAGVSASRLHRSWISPACLQSGTRRYRQPSVRRCAGSAGRLRQARSGHPCRRSRHRGRDACRCRSSRPDSSRRARCR